MGIRDSADWLAKAVDEFNRHSGRKDGAQVVSCLSNGLTILREGVYLRVHQDVELAVGRDSMLMPVSELRARQQVAEETDVYQVAESAAAARQRGYVAAPADWYGPWLVRLRLGKAELDAEIDERVRAYQSKSPDERRLAFTDALARLMPESLDAPLVLFRLVPLAVQIATACAFGDRRTATDLRRQQTAILPAIADCRNCQGRLLECVEQCRACGNPLWKHAWLVAAD
jgi:hypothetical protein